MLDNFYSHQSSCEADDKAEPSLAVAFIGDLASRTGVSPVTIRFYEREGLISPQRIGRFRAYGAQQEARLKMILEMRSMGIPIAQIKEALKWFETETASAAKLNLRKLLYRHLEELGERKSTIIREIELTRDRLAKLENDVNLDSTPFSAACEKVA